MFRGEFDLVGDEPKRYRDSKTDTESSRPNTPFRKPGLISETIVQYGFRATRVEREATEAYYSAKRGWFYDLKLLFRYFLKIPILK